MILYLLLNWIYMCIKEYVKPCLPGNYIILYRGIWKYEPQGRNKGCLGQLNHLSYCFSNFQWYKIFIVLGIFHIVLQMYCSHNYILVICQKWMQHEFSYSGMYPYDIYFHLKLKVLEIIPRSMVKLYGVEWEKKCTQKNASLTCIQTWFYNAKYNLIHKHRKKLHEIMNWNSYFHFASVLILSIFQCGKQSI